MFTDFISAIRLIRILKITNPLNVDHYVEGNFKKDKVLSGSNPNR